MCVFLTHPQAPDSYQVEYPFTLLAHLQRLAGESEGAKATLASLLEVHTVNPVNRDSSFPPEGARRRGTPKEQLVTSFYYGRNLVFSREVGGCQSASEAELDRQLEATYAELRELVPRAEVKAKKATTKKANKKATKKKSAKKKATKKKR